MGLFTRFTLLVLILSSSSYAKTVLIRSEPDITGKGSSCGSGFFISENQILTANHVLGENSRVEFDNKYFPVKIVKRNKEKDLALLEIDYSSESYLEIADDEPKIKDPVTCRGYPSGVWTCHTSSGILKELILVVSLEDKSMILMYSAWMDVIPGMSGGPLLTADKKFIGVLSTKNASGNIRGNFVSLPEIKAFLKKDEDEK